MEQKQKAGVIHGLRINAELRNRIERAMQKSGFSSPSAFMRAAIELELAGRESGVDEAEQRIAASRIECHDRFTICGSTSRRYSLVNVLAKTFLTCVPEPPRDVHDQAVARGKAGYDRFLKSVGMAMVRESQAAMAELLGRANE